MKKTINKQVTFCDKCKKKAPYAYACMNCGIEMCYECQKEHGVSYTHAVSFSGSGDGFYCKSCDSGLTAKGTNKLHNAYLYVKRLKEENEAWWAGFKKRSEAAELEVKSNLNS
jgi:hypothetical protein